MGKCGPSHNHKSLAHQTSEPASGETQTWGNPHEVRPLHRKVIASFTSRRCQPSQITMMPIQSIESPPAHDVEATGNGQKPKTLPCRYCQKRFRRLEHVQRHERTHTKEKPFRCGCGKNFGRRSVCSHLFFQRGHLCHCCQQQFSVLKPCERGQRRVLRQTLPYQSAWTDGRHLGISWYATRSWCTRTSRAKMRGIILWYLRIFK
jgi:hypothetical protein